MLVGSMLLLLGTLSLSLIMFLMALPFLLWPCRALNSYGCASSAITLRRAILNGFLKMFELKGRSNRLEFLGFLLVVGCLSLAALLEAIAFVIINREHPTWWSAFPLISATPMAIPVFTLSVRRLHDVNRSGWWLMLLLVFGCFILLYWFLQSSQADEGAEGEGF